MIYRCLVILLACVISFPALAGDDEVKPELNKKRTDPDYIMEKYTDIFKTTDYGAIVVGPPFKTIELAGIDFSEFGLGRANLRAVLQTDGMFPLRIFVTEKNPKRYNTLCAVFVSPTNKTTIQDVLIKEGFVKAGDKCLSAYPHYIDKFKGDENKAKAANKGIWKYIKEDKEKK